MSLGEPNYCGRCGLDKTHLDADGICEECRWEERENVVPIGRAGAREEGGLGAVSRAAALERIASRPPQWRVRGILGSDDYGVLAGPKGVGKTLALQDLAVSVALGEPWFGRFEVELARVLVLTSEDPEARLWRRFDAIAASKGIAPEALEGELSAHPLPFNAIADAPRLAEELARVRPGLVLLDPAYKYLVGARPSSLFDMGAALTPLQVICNEAGAALLVGHHYNRQQGRAREERISGAGLLEWARVVITAEAPPRRAGDEAVNAKFEISGNSIDPLAFTIRRGVVALDDSPNPELSYSVEVTAEGAPAEGEDWRPTGYMERISLFLEGEEQAASTNKIRGSVSGKRYDVLVKALDLLIAEGYVEVDERKSVRLHRSARPYREEVEGL